MARVFKKTITRDKDKDGRQVQKGTRGARKCREKSAKWYGRVPGGAHSIARLIVAKGSGGIRELQHSRRKKAGRGWISPRPD
jgi:hypothetical protein